MRNNDWERHIGRALELGAYRAELRPEDATRLLDRARDQRIAGRWEGYARQKAARGTLIRPSLEAPPFSLARDVTIRITVRMTFEMAGDRLITGDGELVFHYPAFGLAPDVAVYMDIDGSLLEDGRVAIELRNVEDSSHLVHFSGAIDADGATLRGSYQAFGVATRRAVTGEVLLEKLPEDASSCELVTAEAKPGMLLDIIRRARRSILVTHFTAETPAEAYLSLLLEKLRDEVTMTLIMARPPDTPAEMHGWLRRFRDSSLRPYYQEYLFPGLPLPWDILVADEEIAFQHFAAQAGSPEGSFAMCHYDRRIARRFREYFEALKGTPQQGASVQAHPLLRRVVSG